MSIKPIYGKKEFKKIMLATPEIEIFGHSLSFALSLDPWNYEESYLIYISGLMKRDKLKPIECIVEEFETSANPFGGLCDKLAGFDSARVIIHLKEEPAKLSKKLEYGLRAIKDSRFIN